MTNQQNLSLFQGLLKTMYYGFTKSSIKLSLTKNEFNPFSLKLCIGGKGGIDESTKIHYYDVNV